MVDDGEKWVEVEDDVGEFMAVNDITRSIVKCYKKKTKQRGKEYRYNQYVVPLKKSDGFECKDDVVVLPAKSLSDLMKQLDEVRQQLDKKDNEMQHEHERLLKEHRRVDELEYALIVYSKKSIWKIWMHRRAGSFPQIVEDVDKDGNKR
jgi:hypothetical protein